MLIPSYIHFPTRGITLFSLMAEKFLTCFLGVNIFIVYLTLTSHCTVVTSNLIKVFLFLPLSWSSLSGTSRSFTFVIIHIIIHLFYWFSSFWKGISPFAHYGTEGNFHHFLEPAKIPSLLKRLSWHFFLTCFNLCMENNCISLFQNVLMVPEAGNLKVIILA